MSDAGLGDSVGVDIGRVPGGQLGPCASPAFGGPTGQVARVSAGASVRVLLSRCLSQSSRRIACTGSRNQRIVHAAINNMSNQKYGTFRLSNQAQWTTART